MEVCPLPVESASCLGLLRAHGSCSASLRCVIEALGSEVAECGVWVDVVLALEQAEVGAVDDHELALRCGHDVVACGGCVVVVVGHDDGASVHEVVL